MIKFIQFLKDNGFTVSPDNTTASKSCTGVKSGRPMVKSYTFNHKTGKITKKSFYSDNGEQYKKSKSFNVASVSYTENGKFVVKKRMDYRAFEREAMESLGLVRVVGPVSGNVYWE